MRIRGFVSPASLPIASVLALLAVTEYAFVYLQEPIGLLLALAFTLSIYGLLSLLSVKGALAEALEDVSLLFVYIMLVASLPWFYFRQDLLVPAVYTVVLALSSWRVLSKNVSLSSLGFVTRGAGRYSLLGVLAGIPTGVVEFFVLRPIPSTPTFEWFQLLQNGVYMVVFVGLGEELLFRGLIQRSLMKLLGPFPGLIWSALVFAVMHTVWRSGPELVFTFAAGLLLGYFYYRSNSLVGPIALHATNNILLLSILPYIL